MKSLRLVVVLSLVLVPAICTGSDLIITEVFYNHADPPADDGYEWVEIYNTTPYPIDLALYSIGWGGLDYTFGLAELSGIIPGCGVYVIGGPLSDAENGNPVYDLLTNLDPDIQNGGTASDGVALFDLPYYAVTSSTVPIDAAIYGSPNSSGLLDETGLPGIPDVDNAPAGSSIERVDWADNWQISATPSPGVIPFRSPACELQGIEETEWGTQGGTNWGAGKALYR